MTLKAVLIALLLLLMEPLLGAWWVLVAVLTWASVRTGLRAGIRLVRDGRDRALRARLREEILAQDAQRAIGAAELIRPGVRSLGKGQNSGPADPGA